MHALLLVALCASEPPTLTSLSFLEGTWVRHEPNDYAEETWSAPKGDSLLGMFRVQKKGQTRFVELQTIRAEKGRLVLRIRHLNEVLVPWPSEPAALEYFTDTVGKSEVQFEHETDKISAIVYRRFEKNGRPHLLVRLVRRDGSTPIDFEFERKR